MWSLSVANVDHAIPDRLMQEKVEENRVDSRPGYAESSSL
jgi:hypothetical protein